MATTGASMPTAKLANLKELARLLNDGAAGQTAPLDQAAEQLQRWLRAAVSQGGTSARSAKNLLNGIWLGHPLHPALTDVPLGAWSAAMLMDLIGVRRGADAAIAIGTLSAVPTAMAGMADWADTEGRQRRIGLVHGLLNSLALSCFVGSMLARRSDARRLGIGLSTLGLGIASLSAWLGGELVYRWGTGVSRNAWSPSIEKFQAVARLDSLEEGRLARGEVEADGQKLPLVLLRRGRQVFALSGTCSHWGGPLWEGSLVDEDCVECPWHASQFSLRDGSVRQGPATTAQPRFETRIRNGNVEVRRAPAAA